MQGGGLSHLWTVVRQDVREDQAEWSDSSGVWTFTPSSLQPERLLRAGTKMA